MMGIACRRLIGGGGRIQVEYGVPEKVKVKSAWVQSYL